MGLRREDQETTDDDAGHEGGLQNRLYEFLRDERYLIVIDDVVSTKVWNDLKEAFPNGQNGSRIMLTTRDAEVACLANSDGIPHRLWVLSPADSWELFTRKVFIAPWQVSTEACLSTSHTMNLCVPPQLVAIGRKMVKKCKGIPLLIVGLVDLLSSRPANISGWSSVLHGADMRAIADDATHRWLNLSGFFDKMISSHVKQRLPYLRRLFLPNEIEIPARRFTLSWAAEGLFFGQRYGEFAEEEVAHDCLQQLILFDIIRTENLSSNGNAKTCSIPHDLPMRGVLRTNNASNSSHDDHRWVWFFPPENLENTDHFVHPHQDHVYQQQQQTGGNANSCETLCSFWCFNFRGGYEAGQDVGLFLQRCISEGGLQFLGVLDLEGVDKPCLPEAIGELINLRYLGLRETYLDTLPSNIGKLLKLQTLDTKYTYVRNYPRSIQKLKKLRHLHLNELQYSSELVS
ncbi:disease resistance protein RPM1-like [Macadamia integrifolia]|uniref:disease resistance protein RPM1-like n=1 Tax=Macadamia integrifolia TaxID=60698 RepID=UPI001C4F652B|nr:disease resistance protein RPM1-like [Macadamia integrifolia]